MARRSAAHDFTATLEAADQWIRECLIEDRSILFGADWRSEVVDEVHAAFVDHPDLGAQDFMTKLKGQMRNASPQAQAMMGEMLWALLLFPSNMKAKTKRDQVLEIARRPSTFSHPLISDSVLVGIGSGGPGFNNYRPDELTFLIELTRHLKRLPVSDREAIFENYDEFIRWIEEVPQKGKRQFRHMIRYFAFPDRVERMSSNGDRQKVLEAFSVARRRTTQGWTDSQLDEALLELRTDLEAKHPGDFLDFYEPPLRGKWTGETRIKTVGGEITVAVPTDDEGGEEPDAASEVLPEARQSIRIQSKIAEIGAKMGYKVWIPRSDRNRVRELMSDTTSLALIEELPLNYDSATIGTIEQIDVLWLRGRSMARAFEVEHTTAVYSGLLRMADLLALQPNMDIRLHIVAPEERREKVFREMQRPVFSLLDRGPLSRSCTYVSYESIEELYALPHLAHTSDTILESYEGKVDRD